MEQPQPVTLEDDLRRGTRVAKRGAFTTLLWCMGPGWLELRDLVRSLRRRQP